MAGIIFSEGSGVADSIYGKYQGPMQLFTEKHSEAFESKSMLPSIFKTVKSNSYGEGFGGLTAMSNWQPVGEGGLAPTLSMRETFKKFVEHVEWRGEFKITHAMAMDGKIADMQKQPVGFCQAYHRTREEFGAALLCGAINGENFIKYGGMKFDTTTADKKPLFYTEHPSILGKDKQTNAFEDEFSIDALDYAENAMHLFKGDAGELCDVRPNTIIIPADPEMFRKVMEAIGSHDNPTSANNAFNYQFGRWRVIQWPYLNRFIAKGKHPWILMDSDYNELYGGAVLTDREPLSIESYIDNRTKNNIWSGYSRFTGAFNDWRAFCVGGVAGGTKLVGA